MEGLGQGAGCEFVIFMGMGDGGWGRGDVGGVMEEIWMSKYGGEGMEEERGMKEGSGVK